MQWLKPHEITISHPGQRHRSGCLVPKKLWKMLQMLKILEYIFEINEITWQWIRFWLAYKTPHCQTWFPMFLYMTWFIYIYIEKFFLLSSLCVFLSTTISPSINVSLSVYLIGGHQGVEVPAHYPTKCSVQLDPWYHIWIPIM